jgi:rsbT co-antagonist protein RsbR
MTLLDRQYQPFNSLEFYKAIFKTAPHMVVVYKVEGNGQFTVAEFNDILRQQFRIEDDTYGKEVAEIFSPEDKVGIRAGLQDCFEKRTVTRGESYAVLPVGERWSQYTYTPLIDQNGDVTHIVSMLEDITQYKLRERDQQQQELVIQQQANLLEELSTPLLSISDTTLIMPLIGAIDSKRAQQIIDTLLSGISQNQAQQVILDITGISVVDTSTAAMIIQMAQAVRLLGARIILTGIRPEIAQTIVSLNIDFVDIITLSTLQSGIAYVFKEKQAL